MELTDSGSSDSTENVFKKKNKQPPIAKLKINGVQVEFLIDSVNILTQGDYQKICTNSKKQILLRKTETTIYAFGCSKPVELQEKFDIMTETKRVAVSKTTSSSCQTTSSSCHGRLYLGDVGAHKTAETLLKGRYTSVFKRIGRFNGHEQKIYLHTDIPPVAHTSFSFT